MRLREFRVATVGATYIRGDRDPEEVQNLVRSLQEWYDECSIALTISHGENIEGQLFKLHPKEREQHLKDYRDYIHHDVGEARLRADSSSIVGRGNAFSERCVLSLSEYTMFQTNKNLLGICSGPAESGDQLVIFFGGNMPFVLRRVDDSETCWRLVGVCYVHGIMDGEAVKGSRRKVERMAEDFDLI